MLLRVMLARLGAVVSGMAGMALRAVGMMRSLLVIARLVMLCSFPMVVSRVFVVLGSMPVMLSALVSFHNNPPVSNSKANFYKFDNRPMANFCQSGDCG
jgi:hypothetical protein